MRSTSVWRALGAAVLALAVAAAAPAAAHEERETGGFALVVGWEQEPTFLGFRNAVSVRVTQGGRPVEGLGDLAAIVSLGDESIGPLPLTPVFGEPGRYHAPLIPTAPGAYTFRITGTLGGAPLDQSFTAGEGTFDEVRTADEATFPRDAPSNAELGEAVEQLQGRSDTVAADADDAASSARLFGILGLVAGLIALAVAGTALARGRRS